MRSVQPHWDTVYSQKNPTEVSWYESVPATSLALIEAADLPCHASILDLGGGASTLASELVRAGFTDVTVADLSVAALAEAQAKSTNAGEIEWVEADVRVHDFGRRFDLWHDRAVFHFMTTTEDRAAYLKTLGRTLRPGGHLILATFGPQGPTRCSGLPTVRYSARELTEMLGPDYQPVSSGLETHTTPGGQEQQFLYCHFLKA
ncbi:class I SAM-dependent methyltransferase [Thermoleophilia bacterium SCSIO 60948]|nr:class I SAM-dependent methyltransferase [Thermoleophilia bacterium SCSIO 60948]